MIIGSAHLKHSVCSGRIGRTNNLPLYGCFRNGHCRRGILHYISWPGCPPLRRYRLYGAFQAAVVHPSVEFCQSILQAASGDDGFPVEVSGSLPSSSPQIQLVPGIAHAWLQAAAQTPSLCRESSLLSTISPHHFVN